MKIAWTALLALAVSFFATAQKYTITGQIKDASGAPIPFASVVEVGTTNSTTADAAGVYQLSVSTKNCQLAFSAAGFDTQIVAVAERMVINVELKPSTKSLQEVVVIGYGTKRKQNATGAAHSIRGKTFGFIAQSNSPAKPNRNADYNTEEYDAIHELGFQKATDHPLSTFSIDVDAASYSNVRRMINNGQWPDAGAVRIEEMINYFRYDYNQPQSDKPFAVYTETSICPWNASHKLVSIGLQGKRIPAENLPPSNLVFLIDVSGSMDAWNKLPLVQSSLKLLVDQLRPEDKISIVVYAGAAGLVLPPTSGADKMKIKTAIGELEAGGSTAGGEGIQLAYKVARENFLPKGNNRIILCTDGDFNVGVSSNSEMEKLVERERETGVFLTALGYGMGNYKDSKMQLLADKGNGNHAYIDSESEAKKVLVHEFGGTLFTIAKDVKLQVEFNPSVVQAYRLIGYENRMLNNEDFNDDKKDAGDMGSGHTVTALYEIIPAGIKSDFIKSVDPLKYQKKNQSDRSLHNGEMMTVKFRYKDPESKTSKLIEQVIANNATPFAQTSENFRFAAAVAEFGMLLRNSEFKSSSSFTHVLSAADRASSKDEEGYRKEFIALVQKAAKLKAAKNDVGKN